MKTLSHEEEVVLYDLVFLTILSPIITALNVDCKMTIFFAVQVVNKNFQNEDGWFLKYLKLKASSLSRWRNLHKNEDELSLSLFSN